VRRRGRVTTRHAFAAPRGWAPSGRAATRRRVVGTGPFDPSAAPAGRLRHRVIANMIPGTERWVGRGARREGPGPRRHRRGRHRPVQRRLSPGDEGLGGRGARRQGGADEWVHVACRGMVTHFHTSPTLMRMRQYSIGLYRGLQSEPGAAEHWHEVAASAWPRVGISGGSPAAGRDGEGDRSRRDTISPVESLHIFLMSGESLYGAMYLPGDGWLDPSGATMDWPHGRDGLASIRTGVRVTGSRGPGAAPSPRSRPTTARSARNAWSTPAACGLARSRPWSA